MTKSAQALIWSIEDIADGRFWTFTVPHCQPAQLTAEMWRRTAQELKRSLGFSGMRVFEMHPNGHGLHVHVVTSKFFHVNAVRRITNRMGWGRIHVCRIKAGVVVGGFRTASDIVRTGNIARYLAKYLVKGAKLRKEWGLKGMRLWAAFGGLKSYIRVSQVEFDTPIKRIMSHLTGEDVINFWGRPRCTTRRKFDYWKMRLGCAIYFHQVGDMFDGYLDMALNPCPI